MVKVVLPDRLHQCHPKRILKIEVVESGGGKGAETFESYERNLVKVKQ